MTISQAREIWAHIVRYGQDGTYTESELWQAHDIVARADRR